MKWDAHMEKAYRDGKQYGIMIATLVTSIIWALAWMTVGLFK